MTRPGRFRSPLLAGIGGGVVAGMVLLVPSLAGLGGAGRTADHAALLAGLIAVHAGVRHGAKGAALFRERLAGGVLIASGVSLGVGVAAYALFAYLRPALLGARYEAYAALVRASHAPAPRVAAELARLAAAKASYLDPAVQAAMNGGTVFFFGMLLVGYGVWRAEVARRLRA